MKTIAVLVGLLCTALPATAQSRLYTNADLTPGQVTWSRTVTADELRGLEARQFRGRPTAVADAREADRAPVVPRAWGFKPFAPTAPLSEPWSMTTYTGRNGAGHGSGRRAGGHRSDPRPGVHLVYGR